MRCKRCGRRGPGTPSEFNGWQMDTKGQTFCPSCRVHCPPPDGHEIEGCGSANVTGPDNEGLYDCDDCGIWFDQENADAATKKAKAE